MRRNFEEKEQDKEKGYQFECLIESLFKKPDFTVLNRPHHYRERRRRDLTEEDIATDLKVRHNKTNIEFYVQCKYHSEIDEETKWTDRKHFRIYLDFYENKTNLDLFIAVGIGGTAENPNRLLFGHFNEFHGENLRISTYESKNRPIQPFKLVWKIK